MFISCSSQCLLIQYYPISCNSAVRRKIRLKKQALDATTTKYLKLNCQYHYQTINFQKQPPEVFRKIGVFENFTKFTGKNLRQSPFLIKLQALGCNLLKKRLWHRCFPMKFLKFFRIPISTEHLWWQLLNFIKFWYGI